MMLGSWLTCLTSATRAQNLAFLLLTAILAAGLSPRLAGAQEDGPVIVTWATAEDSGAFMALLTDPDQIAAVRAELAGGPSAGIPNGVILRGDGGVNIGHDWRLEEIELADVTIEVCDATVDYVDEHLEEFLALGRFCPWTAVVIDVIPVDAPDNGEDPGDDTTTLPTTGAGPAGDYQTTLAWLLLAAGGVAVSLAARLFGSGFARDR